MLPPKPGKKRFWVNGNRDPRNASMRANGVKTNATGARADAVDFDDIEVPGNIETPEARLKLRQRISESTHIAVPGAQHTYIGTPHAHDSIYPERIAEGASVLKIPLFAHALRFSTGTDKRTRYAFPHPIGQDGLYVLQGIHKGARLLVEGLDFTWDRARREVVFKAPPGGTFDVCSGNAWPQRFTRTEIAQRRKKTRTFNAWDSQYQLEAKPLTEVRLDPDRLPLYDVEPVFRVANRETAMWLGQVRIVGASVKWDPSGGKLKSDGSSVAVVLSDDHGRRYWHRALRLTGPVATFEQDGKTINGGQVHQLVQTIKALRLPRVVVETNGAGTFAPVVLKAALRQAKLHCGVTERHETLNKNKRILEAIEAPLTSATLWAHVGVLFEEDGTPSGTYTQMRDWNPAITNQPDDDLDSLAGAITEAPERISKVAHWNPGVPRADDWRPAAGVHEVEVEM
jgi:hypothetical protein